MKTALGIIRAAAREVRRDNVMAFAAALAFYTALSLPPILVLLVWFLGGLSDGAESHVRSEVGALLGDQGRALVDAILENSEQRVSLGGVSGWLGLGTMLVAASGVFTQLQKALNETWNVRPKAGGGMGAWLHKRFMSLGLVGVLAFLAAVSLLASTALGIAGFSDGVERLDVVLETLASFLLFTGLFAAVFKVLPDVKLRWRDVMGGAAVTAVLFLASKALIGFYLARKGVAQDYGSAGSAVSVLVWVYLSSAVVLIGAEITQAWLAARGREVEPNDLAVMKSCDTDGS